MVEEDVSQLLESAYILVHIDGDSMASNGLAYNLTVCPLRSTDACECDSVTWSVGRCCIKVKVCSCIFIHPINPAEAF